MVQKRQTDHLDDENSSHQSILNSMNKNVPLSPVILNQTNDTNHSQYPLQGQVLYVPYPVVKPLSIPMSHLSPSYPPRTSEYLSNWASEAQLMDDRIKKHSDWLKQFRERLV